MPRHINDLTGQRFGRLTVLRLSDERDDHNRVKWRCKCDCGREVDVMAQSLTSGGTRSCGCLLKTVLVNMTKPTKRSSTGIRGIYRYADHPGTLFTSVKYDGKLHYLGCGKDADVDRLIKIRSEAVSHVNAGDFEEWWKRFDDMRRAGFKYESG